MKTDKIYCANIIEQKYDNGKIYYVIDFTWRHCYLFGLLSHTVKSREVLKFRSEDEAWYYANHVWRPSKTWSTTDPFLGTYRHGRHVYPIINGQNMLIDVSNTTADGEFTPCFQKNNCNTLKEYIDSVTKHETEVTSIQLSTE